MRQTLFVWLRDSANWRALVKHNKTSGSIKFGDISWLADELLGSREGLYSMESVFYLYSTFGKSLCTYKRCWKWRPRASTQAWTCSILFANTFCTSACEMFLMYAVIAVFNSISQRGRSRYTDNQIYVPYPKRTPTFRTHCINVLYTQLFSMFLVFLFLRLSHCNSRIYPTVPCSQSFSNSYMY
jgi:hypothetical protein